MSAFLDAAFGFPAVVFTVLLVPVILYWLFVMVGAVDLDMDADVDPDLDADAGPDAGTGDSPGLLAGWWQALGLASMPITVSISMIVLFGWFVSLLLTGALNVLGPGALLRGLVGVCAAALAFIVGALGAAVAGRPLSRLFGVTHAESRSDFVGRTCVIRTEKVTEDFGQAEAADPSGATVLIPVRVWRSVQSNVDGPIGGASSEGSDARPDGAVLRYGMTAVIVEYDRDDEVFLVSALDDDMLKALET